jgi:hypothetical protein
VVERLVGCGYGLVHWTFFAPLMMAMFVLVCIAVEFLAIRAAPIRAASRPAGPDRLGKFLPRILS